MKKSFFQKSVARVAMPLGAVAVLAMIPMSSAFAASTVSVWVPLKAGQSGLVAAAGEAGKRIAIEANRRCIASGHRRGVDPKFGFPVILVKPIHNHTQLRVDAQYKCL